MTPMYDAIIVGGGLSGLSLAAHLATSGWRDRSVLIVDDPAGGQVDSWAYWTRRDGLLEPAVSRRYGRIAVRAGGTDRVASLHPYRYQVVHRDDLCRVTAELLAECPGFQRRNGRVERVDSGAGVERAASAAGHPDTAGTGDTAGDAGSAGRARAGGAEVIVDGTAIRATWVFDGTGRAPVLPDRRGAAARLYFAGWEVDTTTAVFDPTTPVLFDFVTPPGFADPRHGARFGYVLPLGRGRALVELTFFLPRDVPPPRPATVREALAGYVRRLGVPDGYRILRSEAGILPLLPGGLPRRQGRILAIGVRAGLVKAGTGYAYQRIQRDSAAITASLVRHGHPFDLPRPPHRYATFDAIMLDVLARRPADLEGTFARLFAADPVARVLNFLDEESRPSAELALFARMPIAPYVVATAAGWWRSARRTGR